MITQVQTKEPRDRTPEILVEMLTENVGSHFLDSGGIPSFDEHGCYKGTTQGYGRHFEKNQCRNFDLESFSFWKFDVWEGKWSFEAEKNIYHFLLEKLYYAESMDDLFNRFVDYRDTNDPWLIEMELFIDWLQEHCEDFEHHGIENSYNLTPNLSQVIQYAEFTIGEGPFVGNYVLLQIHGGCDVRGGYTRPRAFRIEEHEYFDIYDAERFILECEEDEDHRWTYDDGIFYWEGQVQVDSDSLLPFAEEDKQRLKNDTIVRGIDKYLLLTESNGEQWEKWHMYIDRDGNGYCPICAGKLKVY